jgi:hypothetical protein
MEAMLVLAAADDGLSVWLAAGIGAAGVIVGAAVTPFGEWLKRKDELKGYKRNIYRNYLDHAYWYRSEALPEQERQKRAERYVADYHRIQLIGGPAVRAATQDLQEPGSLTVDREKDVIAAFKEELGVGGIG